MQDKNGRTFLVIQQSAVWKPAPTTKINDKQDDLVTGSP